MRKTHEIDKYDLEAMSPQELQQEVKRLRQTLYLHPNISHQAGVKTPSER